MVSLSSSQLILFIAAITVAAGVASTMTSTTSQISQAIEQHGMDAASEIATDIDIISDAGSSAVYNSSSDTVILLVKNTGSTTLDTNPEQVDLLIDGDYETADKIEVVGNATQWKPGEVARITVSKNLQTGEHRIVVIANGDRDIFRFHV